MRYIYFAALLIGTVFQSSFLHSQNIYEIFIASFSDARDMKDVHFELYQEDNKLVEQVSKDGTFQFAIIENDPSYMLKAWKEDYVAKIIHFKTDEYPFINEYEIQDIDIEFKKESSPNDKAEVGVLKWSSIGRVFGIVKLDSTGMALSSDPGTDVVLDEIYAASIDRGDELMKQQQNEFAKKHYEVALMAKANDAYAINRLKMIADAGGISPEPKEKALDKVDMEKINKGDLSGIAVDPAGDILFSVQLGAFSKEINKSKFESVPDLNIIKYEDFTRVFSGEFKDATKAVDRKKKMVSMGYKDAWIVQMKGNKRVGF